MSQTSSSADRPELDGSWVRARFPAFSEPSLEGFAHFENAGGSYVCEAAIEALNHYYRAMHVQPYYPFDPSDRAGEAMDRARSRLAGWLNVRPEELQLGPSTSQNTYVLAQAMRGYLQPGDEIVVTNQDHEANIGAWRRLADAGVVVREWQVDPQTARLDAAGLEALLNDRTRVVAFTHCSNIVGEIHAVRSLTDRIHAAGALAVVDGVSFCPHGLPDVNALGADIYLFSLYKVYGPHLGVMAMRQSVNQALPNQGHFFNAKLPLARFTPAGPDHAQIAAVNGVIDYFEALHTHHFDDAATPALMAERMFHLFHDRELRLLGPLLDFLDAHQAVKLIGRSGTEQRAPTVAFTVQGHEPFDLCQTLGQKRIGVGCGHFYARRLLEALDIDPESGVLRVSFVHYTTPEEVSRLIGELDRLF